MTVLVTGGLGVNGSWVTRKLAQRGERPVVLDLRPDFSLLGRAFEDSIDFVEGDILDGELLSGLVARYGVTKIVHMAAAVGHGRIDPDPKRTFDLNLAATAQLLEIARRHAVRRFLFASSRAVYGETGGQHAHPSYEPITESALLRPIALYDVCKVTAERLGTAFRDAFGLEFAALRFATIYGPGKAIRHKGFGVVSKILDGAPTGNPVVIAEGGEQRDDFIFAEDAAAGVLAALDANELRYSEYNIASGRLRTLHDFARSALAHYPEAIIRIGGGLNIFSGGPNYSALLDITRARAELGFEAKYDIPEGVSAYYSAIER